MRLHTRLARLEARAGVHAPPDLAALERQGADHATIRAAVDQHWAAGCGPGPDMVRVLRFHPAFAADRAAARQHLQDWEQAQRWARPADLLDEAGDPGAPFR